MSWARGPLSRVTAGGMSYQEFYSQLEASIQQEREEKSAILGDAPYNNSRLQNGTHAGERVPGIFFSGQARYARDKTWTQRGNNAVNKDRSCWNCDSKEHLLVACPKPKNVPNILARKVQHYDRSKFNNEKKALKRVLYEVCEQLDRPEESTSDLQDASTYFQDCLDDELESSEENEQNSSTDTPYEQLFAYSISEKDFWHEVQNL
jgi:hypothetical protein